ncbi:cytidylyltransferase domain-containing protein [Thermodesulfobacteriota bacterium]
MAIVQARMSSTRFPGKVLETLCGMPMIIFMLQRVRMAKHLDKVILATSTDSSDDVLAEVVRAAGFQSFRGDLGDVLSRFYQAAKESNAKTVVRLTGDCPLMDGDIIDTVVESVFSAGVDYASNVAPPTYPDGLDVEAFSFDALQRAWREAQFPSEREHVTPYLRRSDLFRTVNVQGQFDCSHLRWTVDYPDDFMFVRQLLMCAGVDNPVMGDRFDFMRALARYPELLMLNRHGRNEGYEKSLASDAGGECGR